MIGQKFLGVTLTMGEGIQLRGGRGRLSVSFGGGEFAGIVIGLTFALNAWMIFVNKARRGVDLGRWLARLEKYHVPEILMVFYVWLTQSRGAYISLAAAFTILQIPKFKRMKLATVVVAILLVTGAVEAQKYFSQYTMGRVNFNDEERASAQYRRQMNVVYQSIAEAGGWFGWASKIPVVGGQKSIDNQFLLTHLIQGELGYILLISIAAESIRTAIAGAWSFQNQEERVFACSMLAIFVIFWITYYAIYMGSQMPQITFLLLGWGQSLLPGKTVRRSAAKAQSQPRSGSQRMLI
jgi:hypothetical protein